MSESRSAQNAAVIRAPRVGDADAVAGLLGELGYPTSPAAARSRLATLQKEGALVLVADLDATPVGLVTAYLISVLHADRPVAVLSALIVRSDSRRTGVARDLVQAAEAWARARGAYRITVASGLARDGAHAFYERMGYEHSARRYSRLLSDQSVQDGARR